MQSERDTRQRLATASLLGARRLPRRTVLRGGLAALALSALGCSSRQSDGEGATPAAGAGANPGSAQPPLGSAGLGQPPAAAAGSSAPMTSLPVGAAGMPNAAAGTMAEPMASTPIAGTPAAMPGTAGAAGTPAGMAGSAGTPSAMPTGLDALQCIVTPAMTEGPFFVDEKLNRSNLLMDETDDAIAKAVPLELVIGVFEVSGTMCKPLSGVQIDIWHANALGVYSDVASGLVQSVDTRGKKFLRGYQLSDDQGVVRFETIYPGWYRSRAIHIHFKLRMLDPSLGAREFVGQMFFDETINAAVLASGPYGTRSDMRSVLNDDDHIYNGTASNGQRPPAGTTPPGKKIMPTLTKAGGGYMGVLKIGLQA